jgi:myo-inositol catabolism protein IolC
MCQPGSRAIVSDHTRFSVDFGDDLIFWPIEPMV